MPEGATIFGKKFGKAGQLEVLGWGGEREKGGLKLYTVKCHECAKDPELFGEALFKMRSGCINKGAIPCGCSPGPKWKSWQYNILLDRWAENGNFKVLEILDSLITARTRVKSRCNVCQTEWDATVNCYKSGRACPLCGIRRGKANHRKPDNDVIERFLSTGSFIQGTIVKRVFEENERGLDVTVWEVYCPVCSNDEYVVAGLCSGKFRSDHGNLSSGKRPCRCSKQNKWTKLQREYQIVKLCADTHFNFVRWVDETKFGAFAKFYIHCTEHGDWLAGVDKFVNGGQRCPTCANSGFSAQKQASVYVFKAEGVNSFVGYGISNSPDRRLSRHKRSLRLAGFTIGATQIFDVTGQQAWDLEQLLKKTFPCNSQNVEGFRREATYFDLYDEVVEFINKKLDDIV